MSPATDSLLLKVLRKESTPRPPVWFMRQAGRCLRSYRTLKAKYDFQTLIRTPELAAKITLLPVAELGVDAAIVFSDILVLAEAMGFNLTFGNARKPLSPLLSPALCASKASPRAHPYQSEHPALNALAQTLQLTKKAAPTVPLIGFCGGPLTMFLYLFEGQGGNFRKALTFIERNPDTFKAWMEHLCVSTIEYARLQIANGIDAFQIFESGAGLLAGNRYLSAVLPYILRISHEIRRHVPVIYFPLGFSNYAKLPVHAFDAIGIDHHVTLDAALTALTNADGVVPTVLQGNIPPAYPLKFSEPQLSKYLMTYLRFFNKHPQWIVNLGHGVIPETPEHTLKTIVNAVKACTSDTAVHFSTPAVAQ